jgi:acetyltransferase-like isoleucine patch superfamily enzyme
VIGSKSRLSFATMRARRTLNRRAGPGSRVFGLAPIVKGNVTIGRSFRCESPQFRSALTTGPEGRLTIGAGVYLNQGVTIHSALSIEIADDVMIGDLVAIYDTNFHAVDLDAGVVNRPVTIGRNAWIGRGALILPGVSIGEHSVVAAGAVVTEDVPPRSLAAGNPARVVRELRASDGFKRR